MMRTRAEAVQTILPIDSLNNQRQPKWVALIQRSPKPSSPVNMTCAGWR